MSSTAKSLVFWTLLIVVGLLIWFLSTPS